MPDLRTQRSAAGGGAVLVLRFAATAVLNYGFGVVLAWLLPRAEFGAVSVLQNVILLAGAVVAAGLPWALARVVAHADGDPEGADAPPAFRAALAGNVALGVLLAAAFVTAQLTPLRVIPTGSRVLTVAVALTILLLSLNAVYAGALQGSRRFDALGLLQTSETATKVVVGLGAVVLLGLGAGGVATGFAAGAAIATVCGWWALRDRLPGRGPVAGRAMVAAAVPMGIGTTSFAMLGTVDVLGLSALGRGAGISAAVIALYQAAAILARAPYFVADSLGDAVFPFMARGRTWAEANDWFMAAYRWILLGLVPLQLVLLVAPGPVLAVLFPSGYGLAAGLVRVLTVGTVGLLTAVLLLKALYARGRPATVARCAPVAVAVEVAGLVTLVPRFGAVGAATAYAAGSWVCAILLALGYARRHLPVFPPARTVAAYAAALAVLAAALVAARQVREPVALPLIAVGVAGYAVMAVWLRLVRDTEVARARTALTALSTRVGPVLSRGMLIACCAALAAATVLWNLATSPDTQYDEVVYTRAAQEVAQGWHLTWTNRPMFVHPPVSFLAEAGWLRLVGRATAPLADAIVAARLLTGAAAVAAVVVLALLASRLAPAAGLRRRTLLVLAVAALAATDPILLRYGRLAIIEPLALLGCLVTLYLAVALRDRPAWVWVAVVGSATGLTLLTKEVTVFMLLTPAVHAVLGWDRRAAGRAVAALLVGLTWWLLFPLWAVRLGLTGSFLDIKFATAERLLGLLQITGWNRPGASFTSAVLAALGQYTSSYLLLATGALALLWLLLHRLTGTARWLLAWLLTSYAFAGYTVLLGTLNEQFFVYVLPAAIVGTVLVADAVAVPVSAARRLAVTAPALLAVLGVAAFSWARFYLPTNDGVFQATAYLRRHTPACAAVNATGDVEKYGYLLPGRPVTFRASGPGALSHGVHLFLLSDKDAAERYGNATPELNSWVRAHGTRMAAFPSATYRGVEIWQVPTDPHDPLADIEPVPGGSFVDIEGSRCGGHAVTDGPAGNFLTGWTALGGKAVAGPPVTGNWTAAGVGRQVFDGAVLSAPGVPARVGTVVLASAVDRSATALPIVPALTAREPAAYRAAGLPPVTAPPGARPLTDAQVRAKLTDPAITAAYLGAAVMPGAAASPAGMRPVLGDPVGPATRMPDGTVRQAFAGGVLEHPAASDRVRLAPVGRLAISTGLVDPPTDATRPAAAPPLPDDLPPPQPTTVEPFVASLGALVAVGVAVVFVALQARRRRRQPPAPELVEEGRAA